MTALEAIEAVLAEKGKPMDCAAITERILGGQLWKTNARVPEQSIHAYLAVDIRTKEARSKFQRAAPGTLVLRFPDLSKLALKDGKQSH